MTDALPSNATLSSALESKLRVVFLSEAGAPPEGLVRLLQNPSLVVEGREKDAFFAEIAAGLALPDFLVGVGGSAFIEALRRHPATACLPIFLWGSMTSVPAGWDGAIVRWHAALNSSLNLWCQRLASCERLVEAESSPRYEHLFLRYLAIRGVASVAEAKVFGVSSPHAAFERWSKRGWCQGTPSHFGASSGLLDLVRHVCFAVPEGLPVPSRAPSSAVESSLVVKKARWAGEAGRRPWFFWGLALCALAVVCSEIGSWDWLRPSPLPVEPSPELAATHVPPSKALFAPPEMPIAALAELVLDAHLIRPQVSIRASLDGRIGWSVAQNATVMEGATLGTVTQIAGLDRSDRLQRLLGEMKHAMVAEQESARRDWQRKLQGVRAEVSTLDSAVGALQRSLPSKQENYQHALDLAEQGVLSFREVRPERDALLALEEELEQTRQSRQRKQQELAAFEQEGPVDPSAQPTWNAQTRGMQVQLEEAKALQVQIPLVAPVAGEFHFLLESGEPCQAGQVLAQLCPENTGFLEAVLATEDWHSDYLAGNARLRRPGRMSWMPTRILSATSDAEGMTRLRLRLPVGWLDDGLAQAAAKQQLLELSLTPPLARPESLEQASQPRASSSVESLR